MRRLLLRWPLHLRHTDYLVAASPRPALPAAAERWRPDGWDHSAAGLQVQLKAEVSWMGWKGVPAVLV
jgi:hypothetical protein